jgi:hypothetical protein
MPDNSPDRVRGDSTKRTSRETAQRQGDLLMSTLVTQQAPDFAATAVMANNSFEEIRLGGLPLHPSGVEGDRGREWRDRKRLPLGRNVDEALRMLDALRFIEEHGEVCPANWREGEEAMKPTAEGVAA